MHCNTAVFKPTTGVNSQEEAGAVLILHAVQLGTLGQTVHIMTQDTDMLVLVLSRLPMFGTHFLW